MNIMSALYLMQHVSADVYGNCEVVVQIHKILGTDLRFADINPLRTERICFI
jgi:hypothetical protein